MSLTITSVEKPIPYFDGYAVRRFPSDPTKQPEVISYRVSKTGKKIQSYNKRHHRYQVYLTKKGTDDALGITRARANLIAHGPVPPGFSSKADYIKACLDPTSYVHLDCRHYNDDSRNDRLENLAWGTRKENRADQRRNQGRSGTIKLTPQERKALCDRFFSDVSISQTELGRVYGITQASVSSTVLDDPRYTKSFSKKRAKVLIQLRSLSCPYHPKECEKILNQYTASEDAHLTSLTSSYDNGTWDYQTVEKQLRRWIMENTEFGSLDHLPMTTSSYKLWWLRNKYRDLIRDQYYDDWTAGTLTISQISASTGKCRSYIRKRLHEIKEENKFNE